MVIGKTHSGKTTIVNYLNKKSIKIVDNRLYV
jgi:hypothetical protein